MSRKRYEKRSEIDKLLLEICRSGHPYKVFNEILRSSRQPTLGGCEVLLDRYDELAKQVDYLVRCDTYKLGIQLLRVDLQHYPDREVRKNLVESGFYKMLASELSYQIFEKDRQFARECRTICKQARTKSTALEVKRAKQEMERDIHRAKMVAQGRYEPEIALIDELEVSLVSDEEWFRPSENKSAHSIISGGKYER